jgi:uncharacterized protein (DUF924 family)
MPAAPDTVLAYWFGAPGSAADIAARQGKLWFGKLPEKDRDITERFSATFNAAIRGSLDHWADTPHGRLALVIVLDQFPHHIHRDTPLAFAQDAKALALSMDALAMGEDKQLAPIERVFLYLPLEHAESVSVQDLSVALYRQLALDAAEPERTLFDNFLDYARKHRDVVARFGHFPHRNAILGRPSTLEETEFLKQPGSRF